LHAASNAKHLVANAVIGLSANSDVAVLFSGGLDSAILVGQLLAHGHRVWPLYVDCGWHWQAAELASARKFLDAIRAAGLEPLVPLQMPLADLYENHWSITGQGVPRADEPDENVYLPGHNPLLLIKAHLWCRLHGVEQLALAALVSNPFADASDDFFLDFEAAINRALSARVKLVRPFGQLSKRRVMQLGRELPLALTFSCFSPAGGLHCGRCNKCAERRRAFAEAGLPDPTRYTAVRESA
jgi:7-cyano-7-deazaguanine synthase